MWICSKCKKGNQDTTSVCTCGAPRMWVCATCETLNPYSAGICSICGAAKPAAATQQVTWGKGFGGSMVTPDAVKPAPAPAPVIAPAPAPAPIAPAPPISVSADRSASSRELSAASEAAKRKRKRIRTGLIIANVALLAANVVGIILVMR